MCSMELVLTFRLHHPCVASVCQINILYQFGHNCLFLNFECSFLRACVTNQKNLILNFNIVHNDNINDLIDLITY